MRRLLLLLVAWSVTANLRAQTPAQVARQTAATIERVYPQGRGDTWNYDEGTVLDGMDALYLHDRNPSDLAYVRHCVDRFVSPDGSVRTYVSGEFTLDNILMARQLLFLAKQTGDARYLTAAAPFYDQLQHQPRTPEGGFWHKQRYPNQMWLDGLYMAEPFYAEYAATTHQPAAGTHQPASIRDIARQFALIEQHTRDPRTGLLYHAWDASATGRKERWADPVTGRSPTLWARGLGWYAMALVDTLGYIPADNPAHAQLLAQLQRCAAAILSAQDPRTGVWFQVLDKPGAMGNFPESSASAMFVYALAEGANRGYLPAAAMEAARHGFTGLQQQFITYTADGQLQFNGTADAIGLGGSPVYRDGSYAYYTGVGRLTNDARGLGALLLASVALEPQVRQANRRKR